nr:23S rRNA (pseudouridine(1915)-N(3))-methyltransferase RlmH [Maliibacterium massiliense]
MRIGIYCVGKLKGGLFDAAVGEYAGRISRFAQVDVVEVPDSPAPARYGPAQCAAVMVQEGERLLARIPAHSFVVALCIEGRRYTSEGFAAQLEQWMLRGVSDIAFVIGGSLGLSPAVRSRADAKLSLSDMTLPHQLARVVLAEQVYRAFTIIRNQTYHK